MSNIEWGVPLTGAQMKALRDAGLPDGTPYEFYVDGSGSWIHDFIDSNGFVEGHRQYHLPANHQAYTLLKAGWLGGRNVVLWFGGDKAPDDWLEGPEVLLDDGLVCDRPDEWGPSAESRRIIAYIRKAEAPRIEVTADVNDSSRIPPVCHSVQASETVTIAKITEADVERLVRGHDYDISAILHSLGLIKSEPTADELFEREVKVDPVYTVRAEIPEACPSSVGDYGGYVPRPIPASGKIKPTDAIAFLDKAEGLLKHRGIDYDSPEGERSMGKTVEAFNAITGRDLTEVEGWHFMALLKMVRQATSKGFHQDSAEDLIAYATLAAEAGISGENP